MGIDLPYGAEVDYGISTDLPEEGPGVVVLRVRILPVAMALQRPNFRHDQIAC